MTSKARRTYALMFRKLLDNEVPRKLAILKVLTEIKARARITGYKLPASRSSLYGWCKQFAIPTK